MADQQPIFIDQFGAGPTRPGGPLGPEGPDEPWWKEGWAGRMELWRAFWVCFVAGHGIGGGVGFGLMIVAMVFGFAFDPGSLRAGFAGLATGGTILIASYTVFAVWVTVTVWRSADNCVDKRWGIAARAVMVVYGGLLMAPFAPLLIGGRN